MFNRLSADWAGSPGTISIRSSVLLGTGIKVVSEAASLPGRPQVGRRQRPPALLCESTQTFAIDFYSMLSSSGTSHSDAASMISEGVQPSMAPSAMACQVVMDYSQPSSTTLLIDNVMCK